MSSETVRAFLALEVEAALRARVAQLQERLRPRLSGIRWVEAEGLHLTLRFLGPSAPAALASMTPALALAARACPPARVRTGDLGLFPGRGSPRVLWLDLPVPETVLALQRACEDAAVAAGFAREPRPFRSHLTLGRFRDRVGAPRLEGVDLGETSLERLLLLRSELRPEGPLYTPLASFALGSG